MSTSPRRLAGLVVGALLAGPLAGAFAASQLHKCIDGGRTVYQQQACSPSAQPETPVSVAAHPSAANAAAKASAPVAHAAATPPGKVKASPSPASSAPATPR